MVRVSSVSRQPVLFLSAASKSARSPASICARVRLPSGFFTYLVSIAVAGCHGASGGLRCGLSLAQAERASAHAHKSRGSFLMRRLRPSRWAGSMRAALIKAGLPLHGFENGVAVVANTLFEDERHGFDGRRVLQRIARDDHDICPCSDSKRTDVVIA